jgi:hypothetical protein
MNVLLEVAQMFIPKRPKGTFFDFQLMLETPGHTGVEDKMQ